MALPPEALNKTDKFSMNEDENVGHCDLSTQGI